MREKLKELLDLGQITQLEYDTQIEAMDLREKQLLEQSIAQRARDDEEAKLEQWKDDIKDASLSTIKKMCKQKAGVMSAFAALESEYFERRELQTTARRLNGAIRGGGVGSAF